MSRVDHMKMIAGLDPKREVIEPIPKKELLEYVKTIIENHIETYYDEERVIDMINSVKLTEGNENGKYIVDVINSVEAGNQYVTEVCFTESLKNKTVRYSLSFTDFLRNIDWTLLEEELNIFKVIPSVTDDCLDSISVVSFYKYKDIDKRVRNRFYDAEDKNDFEFYTASNFEDAIYKESAGVFDRCYVEYLTEQDLKDIVLNAFVKRLNVMLPYTKYYFDINYFDYSDYAFNFEFFLEENKSIPSEINYIHSLHQYLNNKELGLARDRVDKEIIEERKQNIQGCIGCSVIFIAIVVIIVIAIVRGSH